MSKYTQGPWLLDDAEDVDLPNHVGISAVGHGLLAQVVWVMEDDVRMGKSSPRCEANARLIAAAPELLEALQQAVGSLEWAASVIGDIPPKCEYMERIEEAKAIIAKATGETK